MTKQQKLGLIFGGLGGCIGGVSWLVVAGAITQTLWLIILPCVYGLIGWLIWVILGLKFPDRIKLIFGLFILWFTSFDYIVGHWIYSYTYYDPGATLKMLIGRQGMLQFDVWLGVFSLIGLIMIIIDAPRSKRISRAAIVMTTAIVVAVAFYLSLIRIELYRVDSTPEDLSDFLVLNITPQAVFETYITALKDRDTRVYTSNLLTDSSQEIFVSRPAAAASMANEYASISNKPYSIKESGNYAVVMFNATETGSSPYFLQKTDKGWQIDLYTMRNAIRFDGSNNWYLVPGVEHPYLFAFKATGAVGSEQSACEQKGGRWGRIGSFSPNEECDLPMPDGGKVCRDESECQWGGGGCIAELSVAEERTVIGGTPIKKTGRCATWSSEVFGCHARVENGMVEGILCAD